MCVGFMWRMVYSSPVDIIPYRCESEDRRENLLGIRPCEWFGNSGYYHRSVFSLDVVIR